MKFCHFLIFLSKNEGDRLLISVYRKKTSIGLFTQFHSFTPISYKIGFITCLTHIAFKISS